MDSDPEPTFRLQSTPQRPPGRRHGRGISTSSVDLRGPSRTPFSGIFPLKMGIFPPKYSQFPVVKVPKIENLKNHYKIFDFRSFDLKKLTRTQIGGCFLNGRVLSESILTPPTTSGSLFRGRNGISKTAKWKKSMTTRMTVLV